jgi:hypothetical protein
MEELPDRIDNFNGCTRTIRHEYTIFCEKKINYEGAIITYHTEGEQLGEGFVYTKGSEDTFEDFLAKCDERMNFNTNIVTRW